MKVTIEAKDVIKAIEEYVVNNYGMEVDLSESSIEDMSFNLKPVNKDTTVELDEEREVAMKRADELGIQYRSNILTTTLIERIEEAEEALVKTVTEEPVLEDEEDLYQVPSNVFKQKEELELPKPNRSIFDRSNRE